MSSTNQTSNPGASAQTPPPGAGKRSGIRRRLFDGNRLHKVLIVILGLGCLAIYVWHLVAINTMRDQMAARLTANQEHQARALIEQATTSLRVTGHALGWAAAGDMAEANLAAVDAHITRMVQVGPVTVIAVIDQEGTVRVSTNKKLQGQRAATAFPGLPLDAEDVVVIDQDGKLTLVAPMVEGDSRIGAVVLRYERGAARATPATTPPSAP